MVKCTLHANSSDYNLFIHLWSEVLTHSDQVGLADVAAPASNECLEFQIDGDAVYMTIKKI